MLCFVFDVVWSLENFLGLATINQIRSNESTTLSGYFQGAQGEYTSPSLCIPSITKGMSGRGPSKMYSTEEGKSFISSSGEFVRAVTSLYNLFSMPISRTDALRV